MIPAWPVRFTESLPAGSFLDPVGATGRYRITAGQDALFQAALMHSPPCWPLQGEVGARLRVRYQAQDARTAARTLALAGLFSVNRATLVPWLLGSIVAKLPASERAQFAGYLDPLGVSVAALLTGLFLGLTLIAARRPLTAAIAALSGFVVLSAPLVWQNPILIGGGHLGRVVMLLLLLRALLSGLAFHTR